MRAYQALVLAAVAAIGLAGCSRGPTYYPVHGQVLLVGGEPLNEGRIVFQKIEDDVTYSSNADIDSEGRFSLGSNSVGDGALVGKYKVAILEKKSHSGRQKPQPPLIHPRYADFKTSGLEFSIEPKRNDLEIIVAGWKKR